MAIAKYDFESMRQQASKVKEGATNLSTLIKTINRVVEDMRSAWSDPAQQKFEQQWTEMSKKLEDYVPIIEEYGEAVKSHADKIEQDGSGL